MKMEPLLVAKNELYYITKKYKLDKKVVQLAINTANANGKPCRSRAKIMKKLLEMQWVVKVGNKYKAVEQGDRPY